MDAWWVRDNSVASSKPRPRAVAYYRHSADIGQENSVEIQQDNIRAFAKKHGIEIIHEFADRGKSGLNAEGRPAFNEMMEWVRTRDDFHFILVLDISRWGRFLDTDLSAYYESLCTQHGKQVVYSRLGFPGEADQLVTQLLKSLDRFQSADFIRKLSKNVFEGAMKVARQGYRPGGPPPYACQRLMLDESKNPDRILQPGQRKAIQNGRVILVPGDAGQVSVVQEIFALFVETGLDERDIAERLNSRGIPAPGEGPWNGAAVRHILMNQQYAGCVVYNKTTGRLKSKKRRNPVTDWVVTPDAYQPIVSVATFERAQELLRARKRRYERRQMLANLQVLYRQYHLVTSRMIRFERECPSPRFYADRFGGLTGAFQAMFTDTLNRIKDGVFEAIGREAQAVETYEDFIVINRQFTVLIQPSVPVPYGYGTFWAFRPDRRPVVDITLGVPLSDGDSPEILGYLAMPRLMVSEPWVRLSGGDDGLIALHGYNGLDLIRELIQ